MNIDIDAVISTILSCSEDLMLFSAFGEFRECFPDHYDETLNEYTSELCDCTKQLIELGHVSPEGFILHEWQDVNINEEEKKKRGLVRVNGKYYHIYCIADDIKDDPSFLNFLVCWDFTAAIHTAMKYEFGECISLIDNNHLCGYNYIVESISKSNSLAPHIDKDGTYTIQIKFKCEDHAFVMLKCMNRITLVHWYGKLVITDCYHNQFIKTITEIESNTHDNKHLLEMLFDTEFQDMSYGMIGVVSCQYWENKYPTKDVIKHYLCNVAMKYFEDRDEIKYFDKYTV